MGILNLYNISILSCPLLLTSFFSTISYGNTNIPPLLQFSPFTFPKFPKATLVTTFFFPILSGLAQDNNYVLGNSPQFSKQLLTYFQKLIPLIKNPQKSMLGISPGTSQSMMAISYKSFGLWSFSYVRFSGFLGRFSWN